MERRLGGATTVVAPELAEIQREIQGDVKPARVIR
jgi:hypothetical protein